MTSQQRIVACRDLGLPTGFDQRGRAGFADDRRADDAVAGSQLGAPVKRGSNIVTGDGQSDGGGIEGNKGFALHRDPLADFRHLFVQQLRQHHLTGEQPGPILVADAQSVPKATSDQQQGTVALAFQQGVATVVPIFTTARCSVGIG